MDEIPGNVKVFISWSGPSAKVVAKALHSGIDESFDMVTPFMSEADIGAGERGLRVIERELKGSAFGIIIVTPQNMHAPWLNFEAGALSKALDNLENRVVPLLVGISGTKEWSGPLTQFQARSTSRADVQDILEAIGVAAGVAPSRIAKRIDGWWSNFERALEEVGDDLPAATQRSVPDMLEELLKLARENRRTAHPAVETGRGTRAQYDEERLAAILSAHDLRDVTVGRVNGRLTALVPEETPNVVLGNLERNAAQLGLKVQIMRPHEGAWALAGEAAKDSALSE